MSEIFIVSIFQSVRDIENNWRTVKKRLPQSDIWDSHSGIFSCSRLPGSYGVDWYVVTDVSKEHISFRKLVTTYLK
jgi:hypothetical protein